MKKINLPLSRLSFAQKLDLLETLWADLARDDGALKSPAWHGAEVRERWRSYISGMAASSAWEQSKKRIARSVHADKNPRRG